jgi:hypothetical protein
VCSEYSLHTYIKDLGVCELLFTHEGMHKRECFALLKKGKIYGKK